MPASRRFRTSLLGLIAFALVAAQMLGLLHRVVHTPGGKVSAVAVASVRGLEADARNWTQGIFAGHDGDPGCRLFDQLNASGLAPDVPALQLPAVLPHFFIAWSLGEVLARWAALFDARGPPALR